MTALSYVLKIEGTKNPELMQILDLGVSIKAGDHNYCQTYTRESIFVYRLGITAPERFPGIEIVPSNFQKNMLNRPEIDLLTCSVDNLKSTSTLLLLEAGPEQSGHRCSSTGTVP